MIMPGILQTNFSVSSGGEWLGWATTAQLLYLMTGVNGLTSPWTLEVAIGGKIHYLKSTTIDILQIICMDLSVCWCGRYFIKYKWRNKILTFHWSLATVAVMLLVVAILVVVLLQAITLEILHAFLNLSHEECQIFIRSLLNWTLTQLDQL